MRAKTKRNIWKSLGRNWGYLVLATVLFTWFVVDNRDPILLAIGSGLVVLFALFFARTPCAALNKEQRRGEDDYCGNNGNGLLGACHLQRHKWENLRMITGKQQGARAVKHVYSQFSAQAAAFSAIAGLGSFFVAMFTFVFLASRQPPPR